VPYSCHYHLYNQDDLSNAAKAMNLRHFVLLGDSQIREVFTSVLSLFEVRTEAKFNKVLCPVMLVEVLLLSSWRTDVCRRMWSLVPPISVEPFKHTKLPFISEIHQFEGLSKLINLILITLGW
jgi:hypothetical protein